MAANDKIRLSKTEFAELISEVDGLCPLCQEEQCSFLVTAMNNLCVLVSGEYLW